jgi:hypothetical protein
MERDPMILVHQRYFAKPDLREQVIQTRTEASQRLMELRVPSGELWVPVRGMAGGRDEDLPDIVWTCTYPSAEVREAFRETQESDPVFAAIRARQGTQMSRFIREHYRRLDVR